MFGCQCFPYVCIKKSFVIYFLKVISYCMGITGVAFPQDEI